MTGRINTSTRHDHQPHQLHLSVKHKASCFRQQPRQTITNGLFSCQGQTSTCLAGNEVEVDACVCLTIKSTIIWQRQRQRQDNHSSTHIWQKEKKDTFIRNVLQFKQNKLPQQKCLTKVDVMLYIYIYTYIQLKIMTDFIRNVWFMLSGKYKFLQLQFKTMIHRVDIQNIARRKQ